MRHHRQTVKYIHPSCGKKLGLVELVVIDEAAAIPLPFVQDLMGPYLVFMASTINGQVISLQIFVIPVLVAIYNRSFPSSTIHCFRKIYFTFNMRDVFSFIN